MADTNWEYRVLDVSGSDSELEALLNEAGAEGWELVAFRSTNGAFKRPVARETSPQRKRLEQFPSKGPKQIGH